MKVFLWVNSDLDGVGSTVLLGNMFSDFEYKPVFFGDFENQFTDWWGNFGEDYDKVFVVGMPLQQNMITKLDDHRIVFVTDQDEKLNTFDSAIIQEDNTSCTKLLYNKFKNKVEFTKNLKKFFVYIDDYNSYDLKFEESKYINAYFRRCGGAKFQKLVNRFWKGFNGFTESEVKVADGFFQDLQSELEGLELYKGDFKGHKIISTFSKFTVNEVAASILDNYECDVVIVVNPDSRFVSFRKKRGSDANVKFMAEILCDGGGGEFASGGQITEKFMEFTKKLQLV